MLNELLTVTPTEAALAIFAAGMVVHMLIVRSQVKAATVKARKPQFPGLMNGLARIPVRRDDQR